MPRNLWGEFENSDDPFTVEKIIPVGAKRAKLEEIQSTNIDPKETNVIVKVKNPLVTQTIEVMKQTEMLQSLIDTYSNKSGSSNYLLNPCQMIPEVDFPPENAADFVCDDKFAKPFWFIPPKDTDFSIGKLRKYPYINTKVCKASIRKAVCGQLRVAGFTDTAESALVLFTDAIEEFTRNLIVQIQEVHANSMKDIHSTIEITSLEKAYFMLTNVSLTDVHNYFKHNVIARNRSEIAEFNGVFEEYDKLMKESQSMQKDEFHEGDFFNILEMSSNSNEAAVSMGSQIQDVEASRRSSGVLGFLEGQAHASAQGSRGYKDVYPVQSIEGVGSISEPQATDVINPYSAECTLQSHQ